MVNISMEQKREAVAKLSAAFGPSINPFQDKPDWVRKKVSTIIKTEIKAQGSNDGILTDKHIKELIEKVEKGLDNKP